MEDSGKSLLHPSEKKNIGKSSPSQEKNSYKLYRPTPEENPQFADMLPPSEVQDEPNYYEAKPKKNKKYSADVESEKKKTAKKSKQYLKEKIVKNEEDYDGEDQSHQPNDPEIEISSKLTNGSQARRERETDLKEEDYENDDESSIERSAPTSRLDFAMHGI